jgi:riboflavin synthase
MFTGIVTEMGTVRSVDETETGRRLEIAAPATVRSLGIGDSVAVDGVCLTVVSIDDDRFTVEAVDETLDRTTLGAVEHDDRVDLERPVAAAGGLFDGHIVQGHVDGVGTIVAIEAEGEARRIRIGVSEGLAPYLVEKGSITVDGVSLTVTAVSPLRTTESWFEIVLIPHTLDVTVLGDRGPGDRVNLEADVIAKYVERWMEART